MCVGQTKSEIITNELLGAGNTKHGRAYECRLRLIRKEIYHRDRKRSAEYKKQVKRLRVIKKRSSFYNANADSYATGSKDPVVNLDHSYDMS